MWYSLREMGEFRDFWSPYSSSVDAIILKYLKFNLYWIQDTKQNLYE